MNDYIDGLIEGSHKKTTKEHFAFQEASRKRLKIGAKADAKRRAVARRKTCTFKPFLEGL